MTDRVPITCPKCGNETLKTKGPVKTYSDVLGASCVKCGHKVTEEDIQRQARKIADDVISKLGFKKTIKIG